jgi:hypothetical protein
MAHIFAIDTAFDAASPGEALDFPLPASDLIKALTMQDINGVVVKV